MEIEEMKTRLLYIAEQYYSRQLSNASLPPSTRLALFESRSSTRMELDLFKLAHQDVTEALALHMADPHRVSEAEETTTRLLNLRAQAEEGLKLFPLALATYEEALQHSPSHVESVEGRARVQRRVAEAERGEYDWAERFRAGLDAAAPSLPAGEYVGPWKVERLDGRGGGRGAVATRDIHPGELLLAEQPFAIVRPSEVEDGDVDGELVRRIVRKLEEDGSLARGLLSLYAGRDFPAPMSAPAGLNFTTKLGSTTSATVDPRRIRGICEYNCFGASPVLPASSSIAPPTSSSTALYPRAAFFNHSCAPSAIWRTYGDLLVLRARRFIKQGEEIFHSYSSATPGSGEHRRALEKHFGAEGCRCELCEAEEVGMAQRGELLRSGEYEALQTRVGQEQPDVSQETREAVRAHVRVLEETYGAVKTGGGHLGKLRPALHPVYHLMAEASWDSDVEKALRWELAAFEAQGGVLRPSTSDSKATSTPAPSSNILQASCIYNSTLGTMQLLLCAMRSQQAHLPAVDVRRWVELALDHERILAGGGKAGRELWQAQYGGIVKRMGLDGVVSEIMGRA